MRTRSKVFAPPTTQTADQAVFTAMDRSPNELQDSRLVALGADSLATLPEAAILKLATLEVSCGSLLWSAAMSQATWFPPAAGLAFLPDILSYPQSTGQHSPVDPVACAQLERQLQNAFEHEPLEDGILHAAEDIIRAALQSPHQQDVLGWLRSFALNAEDPVFAASTLRCVARLDGLGAPRWRAELVRAGLTMKDIEMRDAAIQAAETWGDKEMLGILQAHTEPSSWLRTYAEDVISDLSE